jgi:hypothetical protein
VLTHSRSQEREAKRARLKDEAAAAYIGADGARDSEAPADSGNVVSSDSQASSESCHASGLAGCEGDLRRLPGCTAGVL